MQTEKKIYTDKNFSNITLTEVEKKERKEEEMLTPYKPNRDYHFFDMIKNILNTKGNIKDIYVEKLLSDEKNIKIYENAFTSNSVNAFKIPETGIIVEDENSKDNYDIYKIHGENIFENFMVWYIHKRFNLNNASDVKIIARMKINYGPKHEFPAISEKLGFFNYISSSEYERKNNRLILLQNVFSAFIGATSFILDGAMNIHGVGFAICYDILRNVFDDIDIKRPSKFEELDDPITKLKNFFDRSKTKKTIGELLPYEYSYDFENRIHIWIISYKKRNNNIQVISKIESKLPKDEAKKATAIKAIEYLELKNMWSAQDDNVKKIYVDIASTIIIKGDRTAQFKKHIENLLKNSNIQNKYLNILLNDESMKIYNNAFTSNSANLDENLYKNENSPDNYEIYETIGDAVFKNFISFYISERFGYFFSSKDVKILAKIKIKYGSNEEFAPMSKELGFLPFITASKLELNTDKLKLLEDVFESFFGATCYILDSTFRIGVGYSICYDILKYIFDKKDIPFIYSELNDPISILKEFFDTHKEMRANYIYQDNVGKSICIIELITETSTKIIGTGYGYIKKDAKKQAAINAVKNLKLKS